MSISVKETDVEEIKKDVVEVINPKGNGQFVVVCEHASKFIPEEFNNLGLGAKARESHVAWDPGAYEVSLKLSKLLDAPLVSSMVSRLVYDCNRPPTAKSSIPERSEAYDIKGNINLNKDEVIERAEQYYFPFRNALTECLGSHSRRVKSPILVTIHTFTPVFHGRKRRVDLGVLHDADNRMADGVLTYFDKSRLKIERNQPYGPRDGVTHTLKEHGNRRGIANVMIEIKNDLVADIEQQTEMSNLLVSALTFAAERLNIR